MDYLSKCLSATEFVSIMLSADFIVHIILNILIFVSNKRFSKGNTLNVDVLHIGISFSGSHHVDIPCTHG